MIFYQPGTSLSTILLLALTVLSLEEPLWGGARTQDGVIGQGVTAFMIWQQQPRRRSSPSQFSNDRLRLERSEPGNKHIPLPCRTIAQTTAGRSRWVLRSEASISGEEINRRLEAQLQKLREKDRRSPALKPEDIEVVYEDDSLMVVNKPNGVLCVPSEEGVHSLAEAVFHKYQGSETLRVAKYTQMVVHRLGMDTSGLIVFAKNMEANRGMNTLFRTRKITREYECLVVGHVGKDQGLIQWPLMRDFEHPPFMRVSTDNHQKRLIDFDAAVVGKKLLEAPKASLTHYEVVSREYWKGNSDLPVTRLTLTSVTGRTHQLNVHCAAMGHPIVGDTIYGWNGDAAPNGGLDEGILSETAPDFAPAGLQKALAAAVGQPTSCCVHAKYLRFRHPVTGEEVQCASPPPF